MTNGDETADSYKTSAEMLIIKKGDKAKVMNYLLKAASLYGEKNRNKAIECLDELYKNLRGSSIKFERDQYFRFLHRLAKSYEDLSEIAKAADIYLELAREIYKLKEKLQEEKSYSYLEILKKFTAYLAKALILYDSMEKYDIILKLARNYYKEFPKLQQYKRIHGELYFCYEHIINASDMTGSRYFREYYAELDRKLREF